MEKEKLGLDYIAVKSKSFALYKAFKEECEKLGWIYNESFTQFLEQKIDNETHDCMYFSYEFDDMEGRPAFALSNTSAKCFDLPSQWYEALNSAKEMLETSRHIRVVELNEDYTALVDTKQRTVRVGCETFSFDKVLEIVDIFKNKKNK